MKEIFISVVIFLATVCIPLSTYALCAIVDELRKINKKL